MEKARAIQLIKDTFENKFDKNNFYNFTINLLDGINKDKAFSVGNAQVKECFRDKVVSYQRLGQYTDNEANILDVLTVHLSDNVSLDRARTLQRNFIADYMLTRGKENVLVAFYSENKADWRFSFVKLDTGLKQDEKGNVKVVNEFTPARRYSFLVGELEPSHTAQSRLVNLLTNDYPCITEIEEAFNVEKVSKEFFANYKDLFCDLVENLKDIIENEESQRIKTEFALKSITEADFCKKLLGQLVFLYFIQKKGWLGVQRDKKWGEGDKHFLRHTFELAIKENKNFFNDYLEPLFYDALANGERDDNWFTQLNCKIPFLNGGLFETIGGYSWVDTDIVFDNKLFSNKERTSNGDIGTGILDVFDRFNFTVKEDEPLEKEVAVDPEMLGKVFEELLEIKDRKSKGAFYTPREIVHYMCQESLINYLCTELNVDEDIENNTNLSRKDIEDFIHHSDKVAQKEAIATQKETKTYQHIMPETIKANAKQIDLALENIKICDPAIGSGAFPVGMLNEIVRARIALVESGFLDETKKRTTYEYKRQAIQNSIYGVDIESGAVDIAKLRLWLSLVVDEEDIENIKALPNLDYKIVCGNSLLGIERNLFNDILLKQLEELKPKFFNETRKSEKRRLKKQIDATIKELTKDGTFDFKIYFSEVFHNKSGFDVIIGNPPYGADIDNSIKLFEKLYPETSKSFKDIYKYFFDKSIRLLKPNGILTFITPNTYLRQPRYADLRQLLLKQNIKIIIDFGDNIFEDAVVPTAIISLMKDTSYNLVKFCDLTKYKNPKAMIDKLQFVYTNQNKWNERITNFSFVIQKEMKNKNKNIVLLDSILEMKDAGFKYQRKNVGLSNKGKNDLPQRLFYVGNIENKLDIPIMIGKDINQWYYNRNPNKKLRFNYKNLIKQNETTYYNVNIMESNIKIIWRQTAPYFIGTVLDEKIFFGNTIQAGIIKLNYKDKVKYKYLCSLLNSSYLRYRYNDFVKECGRVFPQVKLEKLKPLPIYIADEQTQNKFVSVADKILAITQTEDYLENQEKQNAVKVYEKEIDKMVYKLYDLTYEEVKTIDKDFELSEQEYEQYKL